MFILVLIFMTYICRTRAEVVGFRSRIGSAGILEARAFLSVNFCLQGDISVQNFISLSVKYLDDCMSLHLA